MREAQAVMDEAVASRTRTLAAFAITVGSDAAVADLMGLNEREVRVARRTVGKEDARIVADQLLSPPAETSPQPPETAPVPPPAAMPAQPTVPVPASAPSDERPRKRLGPRCLTPARNRHHPTVRL